jgi:hypothetical protein
MAEEKKKLELKDDMPVSINKKIESVFQELYDHYRAIERRNEYLRNENARLKDEAYKDEELAKMKESHDKMSEDYYRGFPISEEEDKKIKKWEDKMIETHPGNGGAIGGRFRYEFIPTGVGTIGTVIDTFTGGRFNFRDLIGEDFI